MDHTFIYSLEYPEGNVRYIGKSNNPKKRFNSHLKDAIKFTHSHKLAWINSLLKEDKKPILKIIDEVSMDNWQFWEKYWIAQFKVWGFDLTNSTEGGDGLVNFDQKIKQRISESLKKYFKEIGESEETKKRKSIAQSKRVRTKEEKLKISKSLSGHYVSDRQRKSQSKTMKEKYSSGGINSWNKGKKLHYEVWNKGRRRSREELLKDNRIKSINQLTINREFITTWFCGKDIEESGFIPKNGRMNIFAVCRGVKNTAYGFKWEFNG